VKTTASVAVFAFRFYRHLSRVLLVGRHFFGCRVFRFGLDHRILMLDAVLGVTAMFVLFSAATGARIISSDFHTGLLFFQLYRAEASSTIAIQTLTASCSLTLFAPA
jgi:hypothetical protein